MRRTSYVLLSLLVASMSQGCGKLFSNQLSDRDCAALMQETLVNGGTVSVTPTGEPACLYTYEDLGSTPILMAARQEEDGWQLGKGWVEGVEAADAAEARVLAITAINRQRRVSRNSAPLDLPSSVSWRQFPAQAALIEISQRAIRVGRSEESLVPVQAEDLLPFSKNTRHAKPELPIELSVDRTRSAEFGVTVLRAIRDAGYEVVNIRTTPPEDQASRGFLAGIGGFEARLTGPRFYELSTADLGRASFDDLVSRLEAAASQ